MYVKCQDEVVVARHDRNDRSNESEVRNEIYLQKGNGAERMALNSVMHDMGIMHSHYPLSNTSHRKSHKHF